MAEQASGGTTGDEGGSTTVEELFGDEVLVEPVELTGLEDVVDVLRAAITDLIEAFLRHLPVMLLALVVLVLALLGTKLIVRVVEHTMQRSGVDHTVERLVVLVLRVTLVLASVLFALSIAGVSVGAALAGIGLAGLALAFALQSILENFIAGVLILVRKPFIKGHQIITGELEGTVDDIDLRVTRLISYDGQWLLVPNARVLTDPLTNHTKSGRRRTRIPIGIDYRDDHDAAPALLAAAAASVEGVWEVPPPDAIVVGFGDSSVDFEVRYWTDPSLRTVVLVRDQVMRACKTALEEAGMTIPWPIRTLAPDRDALELRRRPVDLAGETAPADRS